MKTLFMVVGPQGSGKTTLYSKEFSDCSRISQDDQGKEHHKVVFQNALKMDKSIYLDRINHTEEQRKRYLAQAKDAGFKTKIIVLRENYQTCFDRIMSRPIHPTLKQDAKQAHDALCMFFFQYQSPKHYEADEIEYRRTDEQYLYDISNKVKEKRVIVVGDLHGMAGELQTLLLKCKYEKGKDVLLFVGDLIDRGPRIAETLMNYVGNPEHIAYSIMGNHEYKFIRYCLGRKISPHSLQESIDQTRKYSNSELIKHMMSFPYMIKFRENAYAVHAGIDPKWPINRQNRDACMYTRNLEYNGVSAPWWKHYNGEDEIFFGHEVTPHAIQVTDKVFAMDGGACFGRELRACISNPDGTKEFVIEKCKIAYADYYADRHDETKAKVSVLDQFDIKQKEGFVSKKVYKDLVLYNYTPKCVYERHWDDVTRKARGIIFDSKTGDLVSWVPEKFFNVNEMPETMLENLPLNEPYEIFEKVDGSFVSVSYWKAGDEWIFATRGSFESEQAQHAKLMCLFHDRGDVTHSLNRNYSYIFEVLYPENRMNDGARLVVDYGGERTLVGLTIYDKIAKKELPWADAIMEFATIGFRMAKIQTFDVKKVMELQKTLSAQEEGFVALFANGLRVKFKTDEYIKMNRILNSINIKSVWEAMENGKVSLEFLTAIPEELRDLVEGYTKELEENYEKVYDQALEEQMIYLPSLTDFKQVGLFMKDNSRLFKHPALVFPMLRKKNISALINDIIRPKL